MAHNWEDFPRGNALDLIEEPRRKCTRCGAVQELETTHAWMRVVSRKWRPLVGRCPADRKRDMSP